MPLLSGPSSDWELYQSIKLVSVSRTFQTKKVDWSLVRWTTELEDFVRIPSSQQDSAAGVVLIKPPLLTFPFAVELRLVPCPALYNWPDYLEWVGREAIVLYVKRILFQTILESHQRVRLLPRTLPPPGHVSGWLRHRGRGGDLTETSFQNRKRFCEKFHLPPHAMCHM